MVIHLRQMCLERPHTHGRGRPPKLVQWFNPAEDALACGRRWQHKGGHRFIIFHKSRFEFAARLAREYRAGQPQPQPQPQAAIPPNTSVPLAAVQTLNEAVSKFAEWRSRECHEAIKANCPMKQSPAFKNLGKGAFRVTYAIDGTPLVVKFAYHEDGICSNRDEVWTFSKMTEAQKDCVAPIYAWDPAYHWVIMPKMDVADQGASDALRARMAAANMTITDINEHNCGVLNGKEVVYDFGLFTHLQ